MKNILKSLIIPAAFLLLALSVLVPVSAHAQTTATVNSFLYQGMSNSDVYSLQSFLSQQGFLSVAPTGYFGALTKAAVAKFQLKYNIASTPAQGAGLVGSKTKTAINQLILGGTLTNAPIMSPNSFVSPVISATQQTTQCPTGWTCAPAAQQPVVANTGSVNLVVDTSPGLITSGSFTYYQANLSFMGGTATQPISSWSLTFQCPSTAIDVNTSPGASCSSPFQMGSSATYGNVSSKAFTFQNNSGSAQTVTMTLQGYNTAGVLVGTSQGSILVPSTGSGPVTSSAVTLISPNGGQTYQAGQTIPITWSVAGAASGGYVRVMLLKGNANQLLLDNLSNTGSTNMTLPTTASGSDYKITVQYWAPNGSGAGDDSDSTFTIQPSTTVTSTTCPSGQTWNSSWGSCTVQVQSNSGAPFVSVVSPNGGQTYTQGQTVPISFSTNLTSQQAPNGFNIWAYFGGTSTNVGSYSSGVQNIAMSYTGGSPYNWTIPSSLATGNYVIYIVPASLAPGVSTTGLFAFGNSYFTVTPAVTTQPTTPTISVTSPNGGTYQAGSTLNIQWTATGLTSSNNNIGLSVYQTSLGSPHSILSAYGNNTVSGGQVSNTGSYSWTIPLNVPAGSDYIVYINNSAAGWTQSAPFTISAGSSGISGNQLSNMALTIATPGAVSQGVLKTTTFSGAFTFTAGANPVYVSSNAATAFALSTNVTSASASINNFVPSNGIQSYDASNNYYEITPGSSRTFTFNGILTNNAATSQSVGVGVTTLYLSGDPTNMQQSPQVSGLQGLNSDFHVQTLIGTN